MARLHRVKALVSVSLTFILRLQVGRSDGEAHSDGPRELKESDIYLSGNAFSQNESENQNVLFKWLDDIMWTDLWDSAEARKIAFAQLDQLAQLSKQLPSLAFSVGQALYSYYWFKDNGGNMDLEVCTKTMEMYEISLQYSGCRDLSIGVGTFIKNFCHERWLNLIMITAELGAEISELRTDVGRAAVLLKKADDLFRELIAYPYFSFRGWKSVYDINANSHVFPEGVQQRPIWPNEAIPLAGWLEEHYQVFREDLDFILQNNLFDDLYFRGHVSMTQFSGKRESWAPLNLLHNGEKAPIACQVASKSCELLLSRPEVARCSAKDVGAAFARLHPGMGIKPHLWTAPPRLCSHLGLRVPPGATMNVGRETVSWHEGKSIIFDDSFIHTVKHRGVEARYILVVWFCHPCDPMHAEVPAEDPKGLCPSWA